MSYIPKVIREVVENDHCIGCGLCVYICPNKAIEMKWNEYGFLIPELADTCDSKGDCIDVCPFNPKPQEELKTENELAQIYLKDATQFQMKIGKFNNIYAGYSNEFRLTSSAGGVATYIFTELIERKIVDHVFSVKESNRTGVYYEYNISNNKEELFSASKTKYFPVTLSTVMNKIHELEGKVAIVGVGCFIKAIRLAQYKEPWLKEKIPILIGIICGGVKGRFFTEYLADNAGVEVPNIKKPQFRIKDFNSTAADYSFGCYDKKENKEKYLKMRFVGDMWGTGLFKANSCDFCDDVTTELADISLGDAWLQPFSNDGKGTNVIVTRSLIADKLIQEGIKNGKLKVEQLSLKRFLSSQQGSFNHRHKGLAVRLKQAKKQNIPCPPKRYENEKVTIDFKLVQLLRMKTRQKSLIVWKNTPDAKSFNKEMKSDLSRLYWVTLFYHYRSAILKRLKIYIFGRY